MRGYRFPSTETEHQTVISRFGGADFRSHPTKVSLTRSPDLQNLVCDRNDFSRQAHRLAGAAAAMTRPSTVFSPLPMVQARSSTPVQTCISGRRTAGRPCSAAT
ncbi:MAG: hypothetical protein ACLR4Z_04350 [Butyricicoccaceae bacterium]